MHPHFNCIQLLSGVAPWQETRPVTIKDPNSSISPSVMQRASVPLTAVLITTMLITGCQSKTKATPANFIQALNKNFQDHNECLFSADPPRFPVEISDASDRAKARQFDALAAAQLLTVTKELSIQVARYTPTPAGAVYAPRFCYGHRNVTAIDSFTPPAQANGFPETQVTYRYTIEDVPIWAKTSQVQAAFPEMARAINTESTGHAILAGTLAGWQVPD